MRDAEPSPEAGSDAAASQDAGLDAGEDAALDAGEDAALDAGEDAALDAGEDAALDAGEDAALDAGEDAALDAGEDAGRDASMDAGEDAGHDASPSCDPAPECVCPDRAREPDDRGCIPDYCAPELCGPEDDCRFVHTNATGYYLCDTPRNWVSARNACRTRSYLQLVAIEDEAEDDFLFEQVESDKMWIGGDDREEEGTFVWSTGEAFFEGNAVNGMAVDGAYSNFDSTEPNNVGLGSGGQPDCVILWDANGAWADANCDDQHGFICEIVEPL